ncbi:MAG: PIN domain-containing protein [Prevotella sp.]|nr:PIN domain-containing protein [Prevotella sp.]
MKKYLLDTSTCVFLFRDNHDVAQRLNKIGRERCFICDVVLAELRSGAYKSDRTEENHNVKHFSHIEGLDIEDWVK